MHQSRMVVCQCVIPSVTSISQRLPKTSHWQLQCCHTIHVPFPWAVICLKIPEFIKYNELDLNAVKQNDILCPGVLCQKYMVGGFIFVTV